MCIRKRAWNMHQIVSNGDQIFTVVTMGEIIFLKNVAKLWMISITFTFTFFIFQITKVRRKKMKIF